MTKENQNLSDALKELEKIVERLEQTDCDVEEGLKEFRKGVELVEFCRSELQSAENEFIELKARLDKNKEEEASLEDIH